MESARVESTRLLVFFCLISSSSTRVVSSDSPCSTANDCLYMIACMFSPKPLLIARLDPMPRLPRPLLLQFAKFLVSSYVVPSVLGNIRPNIFLIAGIQAQMIPTLISMFDQWTFAARSQVGLDESAMCMRDCNRIAETTVTLEHNQVSIPR
jgi:hypothetical protein